MTQSYFTDWCFKGKKAKTKQPNLPYTFSNNVSCVADLDIEARDE